MTLTIYIHGKVAVYRDTERIVTDNTDYTVAFDLSNSGFTTAGTKYLVLITDAGKYDPIPFTGMTCNLPAFTHADGASVKIGIYEGDLSTTTYAEILLTPSILGIEAADAEPSDSGNVPVIDDPDDIADDDYMIVQPVDGQRSYATIEALKALFADGTGADDVLWATKDVTTYAEIKEAMDAQKLVCYTDGSNGTGVLQERITYVCLNCSGGTAYFYAYCGRGAAGEVYKTFGVIRGIQTWEAPTQHQNQTANIVTSMSAQSTDTQYPSAKCVYGAIQTAITDAIEGAY